MSDTYYKLLLPHLKWLLQYVISSNCFSSNQELPFEISNCFIFYDKFADYTCYSYCVNYDLNAVCYPEHFTLNCEWWRKILSFSRSMSFCKWVEYEYPFSQDFVNVDVRVGERVRPWVASWFIVTLFDLFIYVENNLCFLLNDFFCTIPWTPPLQNIS